MAKESKELNPSFYLTPEHWSKRYDPSFFTIYVDDRKYFQTVPVDDDMFEYDDADPRLSLRNIAKNRYHPACYYQVRICYGIKEKIIWRRFAQFQHLVDQISMFPPIDPDSHTYTSSSSSTTVDSSLPKLPRKTWIWEWPHKPDFEEERQEGLNDFIRRLMDKSPVYSNHFAVKAFLGFYDDEDNDVREKIPLSQISAVNRRNASSPSSVSMRRSGFGGMNKTTKTSVKSPSLLKDKFQGMNSAIMTNRNTKLCSSSVFASPSLPRNRSSLPNLFESGRSMTTLVDDDHLSFSDHFCLDTEYSDDRIYDWRM